MKIKGAIFDLDGTLVDSLMFFDILWRDVGIKYFGNEKFTPDVELDKKVRTMIYPEAMAYTKDVLGIEGSVEDFVSFAESKVDDFYRQEAKIKPGVYELLEYLRSKGVKIGLASATEKHYINIALETFGLRDYFDPSLVFSCADIGIDKSRPDVFLMAAKALGYEPNEICVFEDSCVALESAHSAGFLTAGLFEKYNFSQDRLKASSDVYMSEGETLADLINKINA